MEDITAAKVKCREMLSRGDPIELVIRQMRDDGLSNFASIRVLVDSGYRLQQAKESVHFSEVWSDVRDRDDEFHDSLIKGLNEVSEDSQLFEQASLIVDSLVRARLLKSSNASQALAIVAELLKLRKNRDTTSS